MLRALLAAGLMALPAAAQTVPPTTPADCAAGGELVRTLAPAAPAEARLEDGWCRLDGFEIGWAGGIVGWRIARMDWQAPGLAQAVGGGPPPAWMALRLGGVTRSYRTGDARIDYQLEVQSRAPDQAIEAELALRLAPALGVLVLERARLALPGGNRVELAVELAAAPWDPAAPWAEALDGPEALKLTRLELGLEMRGLFEFYILPALLDYMADPDDPAGTIAGLKDNLTAALAGATNLAPETRAAATRLLADLPHPQGRLVLRLRSDRGLDGAALIGLDLTRPEAALAAILPLFDGVEVDLTYDPAP